MTYRYIIRIALILALTLCPFAGAQVAINLNSSTIINTSPQHAGINMGIPNGTTSYDSGQYCKNLLECGWNPGFEPWRTQQQWTVNGNGTLSTTQIQSGENNAQYDAVPANFWVGATITIIQPGASAGSDILCTSTITANTVAGTAPNGAVYTFSPACGSAPVAGNVFKLDYLISITPGSAWACGGSGSCSSNTTDLCSTCGTQTIKYDATAGQVYRTQSFDAGSGINYYVLLNGTYSFSYDAKCTVGTTVPTFALSRSSTGLSQTWNDTNSGVWTHYTHSFTASETNTGTPTAVQLQTTLNSGQCYIDNLDIEKTSGQIAANTSRFRDEVYTAVKNLTIPTGGGTPGTCRFGDFTGSLVDWTQPEFLQTATQVGLKYTAQYAYQQPTFPMYLAFAKAVGCIPDIVMPITFSAAEAQGFIDYLAGDGTTTYGAKRIAQGQTTPWTSVFPTIYVALGNENWNGSFSGLTIGYRAAAPGDTLYYDYFQRAKTIFTAMRAQPSFASNIKLITGMQPATIASTTTVGYANPDLLETEGYYANTISDTSTTALLWQPTLTQPWVFSNSSTDSNNIYQSTVAYNAMNLCGSSHTAACKTTHYEENVDTYQGSITQATLDNFVQAAGMGVTAFDQVLENVTHGIAIQNVFNLSGYLNHLFSLNDHIWALVVDMGGATNLVRPTYLGTQLANKCMIGPQFAATIASPDTYNLPANNNDMNAVSNVPAESAFAFSSGNIRAVCLINRDVSNSHTVTFTGPDAPPNGSTVTETQLNYPGGIGSRNEAANQSATNATSGTITLSTGSLTSFNPSSPFVLAPASAQILIYNINPTATYGVF